MTLSLAGPPPPVAPPRLPQFSDVWVAPGASPQGTYDARHPFLATVVERRELHSRQSDRSCVHVELDIAGMGQAYAARDHVNVYPENVPAEVERAARLLGIESQLDVPIRLSMPAKGTQVRGKRDSGGALPAR